ncbi:Hsp20/alpha crystallin family protein [Methylobacterium sp. SyP6R]|uniref:Hsp20/alpha crystallin family protein n=1 Tax=Methylobacterium sp. SyP6R TaxID=2718876 RepID=UPI001F398635|nr:Hsp20/alpha crystallin family protein [Methylobacterium sp. SyP6R]MCF4129863.1 Hsp20/alpha crystallin family protein [Methylobacterium sp. SyP6R]
MNLKSLLAFNRGDDAAERALPATFPFQREIDRMLGDVWSGKVLSGMPAFLQAGPFPRMDVVERADHVEVTAELPGLERADVHIELADDLLLIRGEKRQETEETNGARKVTERSYGAFSRTIELPPGTRPEEIDARMDKGVLTLKLPKPKTAAVTPKAIEIKAA